MSGLTLSDYAYLEKLGIRVVCDFRDPSERANERVAWPSPGAPRLLADDYDLAKAGIIPDPVTLEHATADEARRKIAASYPRILKAFNGQYRRMFRELLAGHAPLAFNCTAGKDRTGVAAALLLIALDVPRETVVQDYLLTNRYLDQRAVAAKQDPRSASNQWMRLPAAVLTALGAADRSYIGAVFSVFDRHPGGANGYFRSELGLSRSDIGRLRHMYLE
jgi:protein-tyrosine phosphatase